MAKRQGLSDEMLDRLEVVTMDYASFHQNGRPADPNRQLQIALERLAALEEFLGEADKFHNKVAALL